jgi:catecholate siderophore receptor
VFRSFLVVLISSLPSLVAASAPQAPSRDASGTVVDSSGGAVAGAVVTFRARGATDRRTTTDAFGRFALNGLPDGPAKLVITFEGFAAASVDLDMSADNLRIVLRPAGLAEALTVRGVPPTSQRTSSATRTDTPVRDVPQSISIVTRELMTDQTMSSMADVVRYMPGVGMAQGEGHRDAPIIRGNTSTADFYVDGMRDDVQYLRDVYNVERVEAIKGPNGMIFGRGGVGGVINRVTRQADWTPAHELSVQGGAWDQRRITGDVGHAIGQRIALRLTGMFEDSDTYRDGAGLQRYGINPTVALALGSQTTLRAGYEHFRDDRTTDRGVPSFAGRPLATDPSTFFGSSRQSSAGITVDAVSTTVEHTFGGGLLLRSRLAAATYDKFYQNVFPGAVNASGTQVRLEAYNSATDRQNVFSQTDVLFPLQTGRLRHSLVAGVELGRQETDNLRRTGYFDGAAPGATSVMVPVEHPSTTMPVAFRASASDANNHGVARAAAVYVQDQISITQQVEAIVGARYDRFTVDLLDNRTATSLRGEDNLFSPRLALVYKPRPPVSVYASYALSHLPRAGEQLASLTLSNQALDPEEYRNYEVGAKWDVLPALGVSGAVYRLDRGNVAVPDPLNPGLSLLVDAQRTRGIEIDLRGALSSRWTLVGGYAYQLGEITEALSATVRAGARLAQVPAHSASLWSRFDVTEEWGVGLGVVSRSDSFVATDNAVVLPGFTRVDAAVFFTPTRRVRVQLNVENLFDERYYASAHNNNNIMPGSPRGVRLGLTTRF